jgi:16S rRNA processing protein RimM
VPAERGSGGGWCSRSLTDPADLVTVGRVGRAHGLDGSFVVEDASDDPARFESGAMVLVDGEAAKVVERKHAGGRLVVRLDRPVQRGAALQVRRGDLPEPEPGTYYAFELVGLAVEEEGGRMLGTVEEVAPGVANDVLELDSGVALPMVAACVQEVDLERRRILVARGFTPSN